MLIKYTLVLMYTFHEKDLTFLVVGDIANELSRHASQVYLSTRSGGYIVKRLVPGTTKPFDHQFTRAEGLVNKHLKRFFFSGVHNAEYDFVRLGLQPSGIPLNLFYFYCMNLT